MIEKILVSPSLLIRFCPSHHPVSHPHNFLSFPSWTVRWCLRNRIEKTEEINKRRKRKLIDMGDKKPIDVKKGRRKKMGAGERRRGREELSDNRQTKEWKNQMRKKSSISRHSRLWNRKRYEEAIWIHLMAMIILMWYTRKQRGK